MKHFWVVCVFSCHRAKQQLILIICIPNVVSMWLFKSISPPVAMIILISHYITIFSSSASLSLCNIQQGIDIVLYILFNKFFLLCIV